ncbi:MAG: hypothetical protein JXB49_18050 [Bacteroidales bacterium]|nr:hypothetical protein [Bacteroidales bacterium]
MKAILTSLLILFAFVCNAQEPGPKKGKDMSPDQRAENWVKKLETQITFSAEERGSMVEIFKDFFVKLKDVKQEQQGDKIPELKNARNQKVKELLGEERYAKYMKYMEENEPKKGPPQGDKPKNPPPKKSNNPGPPPEVENPPVESGQ